MSNFDNIVSGVFQLLKRGGFKKSGSTFYQSTNSNSLVINFQKSKTSNPSEIRFTINFGVFSAAIFRALRGKDFVGKPEVEICHWRSRVGDFLQPKQDFWWIINASSSSNLITEEVNKCLLDVVLPNLRERGTDENLLLAWERGEYGGLTEFQRIQYVSTLLKIYQRAVDLSKYKERILEEKLSSSTRSLVIEHFSFLDSI